MRNLVSPSGLTDVEIMSDHHSHGGGGFEIPVKPWHGFQEMN